MVDNFIPLTSIKGGCSTVYIVRERETEELFAMKVPRADMKHAAALIQREIAVLEKLRDPDFVKLHGADKAVVKVHGADKNEPFILLEYLGRNCLHCLRPDVREAVSLYIAAAESLSSLHAKGLLHRDLKPKNIFVTMEGIKFVDFALAKLDPIGEFENKRMGTLAFMAPEQFARVVDDPRSDVYSLGMSLYFSLTRKPAVDGKPKDLVRYLKNGIPPVPLAQRVDFPVPPILDSVVMKAIEKDPEKRFQSPKDLADALKEISSAL